jgi:tetratricopeptide (TPR) repeat protein
MRSLPTLLLILLLNVTAADETIEPLISATPVAELQVGADIQRTELITLRDVFIDIGDYSGALSPAEEILEQTKQEFGDDDPRIVPDLNALAEIQLELGEYRLAEGNYLRSISILESQTKKFSLGLIEPYHGLGKAYIGAGDYGAAVTVLDQARYISRRNFGLFNLDQVDILDDQTIALISLGDTLGAQALQRDRLNYAVRTHGKGNPEVLPYHYDLAAYYSRSRMKNRAWEQYQQALAIESITGKEDDPALLPTLRAILALNMGTRDTGKEALQIRAILDNNPPQNSLEKALSLTSLGDWHLARLAARDEAFRYYRAAYSAASPEEQEFIFAAPTMVDFVAPIGKFRGRKNKQKRFSIGDITLELRVTAEGTAEDVVVVSANPSGVAEPVFLERMGKTNFRPRFDNGEPIATPRVRIHHRFWYFAEN